MALRRLNLAASLLLLAWAAARPAAAQAPAPEAAAGIPDISAIPPACVSTGASLQTECGTTFAEAQAFFNIAPGAIPPPGSIGPDQIQAYLAQAQPPSPACCKVACEFNNAFCSCSQPVIDFAATLAGNAEVFQTVGAAFAQACRFKAFIGTTCPAPELQATTPMDACAAAGAP